MKTFQWKLPRITVESVSYGAYLVQNPDMIPEAGIDLNTEGYIVTDVDYGDTDSNTLPFKKNDWIEKSYVETNFRQVTQ